MCSEVINPTYHLAQFIRFADEHFGKGRLETCRLRLTSVNKKMMILRILKPFSYSSFKDPGHLLPTHKGLAPSGQKQESAQLSVHYRFRVKTDDFLA